MIRRRHVALHPRGAFGQSLVEFALVAPILFLIFSAIIQFALVFWAQNTLSQVVRDTGRWAATQQTSPCESAGGTVVSKGNELALTEALFGYAAGQWSGAGYVYGVTPAPREGIELGWQSPDALDPTDCPPDSNAKVFFLNIRAHHEVPLFFPIIGNFIPSCDSDSCTLSSAVQFRMEPAP